MQIRLRAVGVAIAAFLCLFATAALAQMPEGPQLPSPDMTKNATHGALRIGYYAQTSFFRYHGDYTVNYNAFQIGGADINLLADVDIEATNAQEAFQPNRLVGTFEASVREPIHGSPIGIFYRHQSAHNIDLTDRSRPAWEQLGLRYQFVQPSFDLNLSIAHYTHSENCFYNSDIDLQGTYWLDKSGHNPLSLFGDIHSVGESGGPRSGFTDYWIEPNVGISKTVNLYVGYGSTHDVDTANGISSTSVIIGVKFGLT
jgi:hypothetical protein